MDLDILSISNVHSLQGWKAKRAQRLVDGEEQGWVSIPKAAKKARRA